MFFGFYCVRRLLISLNLFYILLSITLVSTSIYANSINIVPNANGVFGGLIFCGVFLFVISLIGLIGTLKHHQVCLFFYMVMLLIGFIIQFVIACVCLAFININSQKDLLFAVWNKLSDQTIQDTQYKYNCCGFLDSSSSQENRSRCPAGATTPCYEQVKGDVTKAFELTGILALLFSFMNLFGVWMAMRYRNQRDPKYNPNQFL